ncbi:phosphoribosylamine--glycine ligase [Alterisphingorhabdus coralli]|uniref:Phosphoribosylamine--glycine ligase n=1 Tax=Alterisphingorhabdus coralli TaxID=3071408 RepID=A0AA97I0J5_9SPHN|nr:phosphoribosylamine--glycine ligase [Parasphingorhabdus sp. SCSIO 66989]WOE75739.1 phosphoribosylamine--glycine ligase [Parasphingorhabdus sp. SCSIO 66989]
MNILLIGGGGREHALCWKLAQSPSVTKIFAAPGNPGMAEDADCVALAVGDHQAVVSFCEENAIDQVVIGPEAPLVDGLADSLRAADIAVFGPSAAAAQLEGSKAFTKALCDEANIPTAAYVRASNITEARAALSGFSLPVVIKADGLAAGKGVIIAETAEEAENAIGHMFAGGFGDAGAEVVVEEFLKGEEASFFALTDGGTVVPFGTAQDHKRVGEGDTGPNTGGMGAYSPAPVLTDALQAEVMEKIITPTVKAMAARGTPYSGVLYAGLMLTADGPELIEYNCRFGDPECQVLMMRLESDLAALMLTVAEGRLANADAPTFADTNAITVVMAAKGYPGTPEKGAPLDDLDHAEARGAKVFHAGTKVQDGQLVANGGRVLNVTATGETLNQAREDAYAALDMIDFPGGFWRSDIGWREIARDRH